MENQISEVKVIAVKLPFDLEERLLTFPFLHALREAYPEADLHFITPRKEIEVLNLLPFKAYYHEFDEDEIETVFDVHRYCVHAKIYNVDLFVSLTNSFADACLGLGLRAKRRAGFSDGWKTMVLNVKTPRPQGHHLAEDFLALYREITGHDANPRMRVIARDLTPVIEDWDEHRYIAVDLAPIRGGGIDEDFHEFLSLFENQRIVLFCSEDQEQMKLFIESFLRNLPPRNVYVPFYAKDWIELGKMLAFAQGVLSYNGRAINYSAYIGTRTIGLYDRQDPRRTGPYCFFADVLTLEVNDPSLSAPTNSRGPIQDRKRFNMGEVFEKAISFFRL